MPVMKRATKKLKALDIPDAAEHYVWKGLWGYAITCPVLKGTITSTCYPSTETAIAAFVEGERPVVVEKAAPATPAYLHKGRPCRIIRREGDETEYILIIQYEDNTWTRAYEYELTPLDAAAPVTPACPDIDDDEAVDRYGPSPMPTLATCDVCGEQHASLRPIPNSPDPDLVWCDSCEWEVRDANDALV